MNHYVLCGSTMKNREQAYEYMKEVFDLPSYTGHNLDALWDVLHDKEGAVIEIDDARAIVEYLGDYGLRLLDVFGDLQREEGFNIHLYW